MVHTGIFLSHPFSETLILIMVFAGCFSCTPMLITPLTWSYLHVPMIKLLSTECLSVHTHANNTSYMELPSHIHDKTAINRVALYTPMLITPPCCQQGGSLYTPMLITPPCCQQGGSLYTPMLIMPPCCQQGGSLYTPMLVTVCAG